MKRLSGKKPKFQVGDNVRVSVTKDKFSRGFKPRFNKEVFKIKTVATKLPIPTYTLTDYNKKETIEGEFYEFEITPVIKEIFAIEKILQRKVLHGEKLVLVKWRGYKNPEWIPEKDLI